MAIEDDSAVRRILKRLFESEGYEFQSERNGTSGLERLRKMAPSVLILGLQRPDIAGQQFCRTILNLAPTLPIIVLSAKAKVADKVLLLEMGVCDFVSKPFSPRELLARVRAAMRRSPQAPIESVFVFDDVTINFSTMELARRGESIWLTAQEFKTLRFMMENPERVISREELQRRAWGYQNYLFTRSVDNHIAKLRQKLEKDPADPVHFKTVHGVGYKFVR